MEARGRVEPVPAALVVLCCVGGRVPPQAAQAAAHYRGLNAATKASPHCSLLF